MAEVDAFYHFKENLNINIKQKKKTGYYKLVCIYSFSF